MSTFFVFHFAVLSIANKKLDIINAKFSESTKKTNQKNFKRESANNLDDHFHEIFNLDLTKIIAAIIVVEAEFTSKQSYFDDAFDFS